MDKHLTQAVTKYRRISPRKARLTADLVRGKQHDEAARELMFCKSKAAPLILKTLKSAVANYMHKRKGALTPEEQKAIFVKEIFVDGGPTLKRSLSRARGAQDRLNKPTSHITVRVTAPEKLIKEAPQVAKKEAKAKPVVAEPAAKEAKPAKKAAKKSAKKAESKPAKAQKSKED